MEFHATDIGIVVVYILSITLLGIRLGSGNRTVSDYFLGAKRVPWWAACLSIVATETSTLTFISVPAISYLGDFTFLQIAMGYVIGRTVIAFVLLPKYFGGGINTVYELLHHQYGLHMRHFGAALFQLTRLLADGVRLFATSIPLHLITGWDYSLCILIIALFTIIYTLAGGIKAVIWTDVIQTVTYLAGALFALIVLSKVVPNGFENAIDALRQADKLKLFVTGFGSQLPFFQINYTVFSGLIGGAFLSMASHGTDHLIVQRLLCCSNVKEAQKALIVSGFVVFVQFALFLLIGSLLYIHFNGEQMVADTIFSRFILSSLPTGLRGLLIAAIFASAMSTLSSSINSLASSSLFDFFASPLKSLPKISAIAFSRLLSLFWGLALAGAAMLFRNPNNPVVELGLAIASYTYGGLLGIFLLSLNTFRLKENSAIFILWTTLLAMVWIIGPAPKVMGPLFILMVLSGGYFALLSRSRANQALFLIMIGVLSGLTAFAESPQIAWPWYVPAGSLIALGLGTLLRFMRWNEKTVDGDR